jgi:hypothetical protein
MENKNINQLIEEILKKAEAGEVKVGVIKLGPKEPEDDQWKKDAADHAAKIFAEVAEKYLADWLVRDIIKEFVPRYIESLDELEDDE